MKPDFAKKAIVYGGILNTLIVILLLLILLK